LGTIEHQGTAHATGVKAPGVNALTIAAEWRGHGAAVEYFKIEAESGGSQLIAAGKVDPTSMTLTTLDFLQGAEPRLRLAEPTVVRWRPQLQLESLRLAGPEGTLNVLAKAGETGRIEIAARNVSGKWFSDLVAIPGPPWTISLFALVGSWDRGPMSFSLTTGASVDLGEGRNAAVNVAARGDRDGIRIEALRATEADATVLNATGRVPFSLSPGGGTLLRIDPDGTLQLDATVAPNAAFWQKLAAASGVELKEPEATAHLTGTWRQPEGNASLRAARIAIDPKRVTRPLPTIEALDIEVVGDRNGVTLRRCSVKVEGQTVQAGGRLPVPEGQWDELFKEPLATARKGADLRLEIPDAEVAVFTRFLPAVLAPKGRMQADVHYKNGGLEGFLRLRDAASRPLGPLGVLQEVSADIAMSGRKFALRGVTAKSGGQPVTLSGTVELTDRGPPRFDLALRGENLPFVRQTGLLVRGDLDLKLQTAEAGEARLSGNVRLRDSLFLSDVRAFLPKGGTSATRRPPYFAIETAPVNTWTLAVDVSGERFLRLRTPVFTGVASARFRLGGTLGEPRAVGEIEIDEGNVRMPFANFAVTQGSIRLTEADPYEPAVYLRGTARRYDYDLTMEIDGTASQPDVVFTSSPPLDSEQVLLMVMTGAVPSKELNKSATQRVANIGLFLGQGLLGSLGADAGEADKLSFSSGEKISRQGKETYDVEYKLSDRWTLTGEYNEFDEYNAGVKWRVFGGKKTEPKKENAKK
jgi:translocation and assembly module TamB